MMVDNKGQISLEYLLIFTISLILLIMFTLPLSQFAIENTLDVSDTLKIKSDLSKIAQAIEKVYGQGQGSKQTISIDSSKEFKITVADNYISSDINLKDSTKRNEKIYFKSSLKKSNLYIGKGVNSIIVEWPINSENMQIYVK
ncbi:MAG: class III signal peptide-containing protein [Methanobrevibacter sp.]|nr:class III signal peptide-containing protein [Methanobrevibacter sp.]MBR1611030.1 class III signal peptide-containing protein [Methanobrevibacter sp.]